MNTKLHTIGDGAGRPIRLHLTARQTSDFKEAEVLLLDLPAARVVIADRGYDRNKVRKTVTDQDIEA
ncbi:transposase [Pseudovibrio ascidiaceicola]|uniref:transposase n=1 Tax=Pseudovibrio ascidiaceicola TaxID=285279 RepID=UPI003D35BD80